MSGAMRSRAPEVRREWHCVDEAINSASCSKKGASGACLKDNTWRMWRLHCDVKWHGAALPNRRGGGSSIFIARCIAWRRNKYSVAVMAVRGVSRRRNQRHRGQPAEMALKATTACGGNARAARAV